MQTTVEIQPDQEKTTENKNTCIEDEKEMSFGKFANAQALLVAYQNLEREFTKKVNNSNNYKNKRLAIMKMF